MESGKPTLSTTDQDLNHDLPINGSPVSCESGALDHAATEADLHLSYRNLNMDRYFQTDDEIIKPFKNQTAKKFKTEKQPKHANKEINKKRNKIFPKNKKMSFEAKGEDTKVMDNKQPKSKKRKFRGSVIVANMKRPRNAAEGTGRRARVPVPQERLDYHSRGEKVDMKGVRNSFQKKRLRKREKDIDFSTEQAARTELLQQEDTGYLEADEGEVTTQFTQKQIAASVDITSASKHFNLDLREFGPYRMNYSRNGRYLLLGGKRGHVAALDWVTKKLYCEINVMEEVFDVRQKEWVYIYDNQGIELHCLKKLNRILRMEFLPYHFLLATASDAGYLSWLDISIGEIVSNYNTKMGRLNVMTQNPYNAVLCLGHSKGIVTMWTPNMREPVAKMLCHPQPVQAVAVDSVGTYMATASSGSRLKIWDVRMLSGPLQDYKLRGAPSSLSFSQRGMLAVGAGNMVEATERPYLRHNMARPVGNLQFCAFEDVLGVATGTGFTSLLIPGCAEPNFDALENNPYQTKSQRRESEVKALLEKFLKPAKIDYEPRNKGKQKKGTAKEFVKTMKNVRNKLVESVEETPTNNKPVGVLDRFKPKKTVKQS
uniref:BING4 C-terminal domain-containing protein n=1 Tax=Timema bartmani TaxID=61472 RepID=A0A7R9EWC2_9NEOP|nr:unnamed protein product [Timema bartmani]